MRHRKDGVETRHRIVDAAVDVFSRKGFRDATIGEICKQAGTNTASVNYHFGDKESLYVEAWRQAFTRSHQVHPPDGGVARDAPAEERLRGHIRALVARIVDPESRDFDMVHKEMANPTGLLAEAMHRCIEPIQEELRVVVGELLDAEKSATEVRLCARSIQAQCMQIMLRERQHLFNPNAAALPGPPPLKVSAEAVADHVTQFSLAGIREIRKGRDAVRR